MYFEFIFSHFIFNRLEKKYKPNTTHIQMTENFCFMQEK